MKVLVSGSRGISVDVSKYMPQGISLIISGGAVGIDAMAEKYADEHGIPKLVVRPDYKNFGRVAPILRNHKMIDMADMVIAIWDGRSRGTKDVINYAIAHDKRLKIYTVK